MYNFSISPNSSSPIIRRILISSRILFRWTKWLENEQAILTFQAPEKLPTDKMSLGGEAGLNTQPGLFVTSVQKH